MGLKAYGGSRIVLGEAENQLLTKLDPFDLWDPQSSIASLFNDYAGPAAMLQTLHATFRTAARNGDNTLVFASVDVQ